MRPPFDWSPEQLEQADTIRMDGEPDGPPSRPTLSDSPRALGSAAGLDDGEREFFREGDEGRYPGGPATLVPVAFDDEPAEAIVQAPPPDPRQLARRVGFSRAVALFVGALAAVALVALVRPTPSAHAGGIPPKKAQAVQTRSTSPHTVTLPEPAPKSVVTETARPPAAKPPAAKPIAVRRAPKPEPAPPPPPAEPPAVPQPAAPTGPPPTAAFPPAS